MYRTRLSLTLGLLRVADPLIVLICGLLAHYARIGSLVPTESYAVVIVLGALLTANLLAFGGSYRAGPSAPFSVHMVRTLLIWFAVIGILLAGLFLAKTSTAFSRGFFVYWVIAAALLLLVVRMILATIVNVMQLRGQLRNRVAVLGGGNRVKAVIDRLYRTNTDETYVIGGFVIDPDQMIHIQNQPAFGTLESLIRLVERGQIDEIVLAFDQRDHRQFRDALKILSNLPVNIVSTTGVEVDDLPIIGTAELGGLFVLRLSDRPLAGWHGVAKTIEDKVLAVILLIVTAPLMLTVAMAIKLSSPGPVFFRQMRYGFNNNPFEVFKFRTMRLHDNSEDFLRQATQRDPRVTPIGRLLRRTSMDELPQLINVLQGTMSVVGPRPHAVSHNTYYGSIINGYLARHRVKPGITGWAQIHGLRGETHTIDQMKQRLQYDLYYIENWSIMLDLRILLMTPVTVLSLRNAY